MITIQELLKKTVEVQASDLHITADAPPLFRIDGKLKPIIPEKLTAEQTKKLTQTILTEPQKKSFEKHKEINFSFGVQSLGRFRANAFLQRGCTSCTLRHIPMTIKGVEDLGLPKVIEKLTTKSSGLILVTGPAGSGKTTTLASLLDRLNAQVEGHILTIEDPIEYIHLHKKCIVNQREMNHDTVSYERALFDVTKQNPDVVMISDLPDPEAVYSALTIAETGHLTLAAMPTGSAVLTLKRIIDLFPGEQKELVRGKLAMSLEGLISQKLLPQIGGGLALASEILLANTQIRSLIMENAIDQIQEIIESSHTSGMQSLNSDLARLYAAQKITKKDALSASPDPESLLQILG